MGRKTYLGIPANKRPLPDRLNIVLTGSSLEVPSGVILCKSLDEAMTILETNENFTREIENVWIAGGYSVYKARSTNRPGDHLHLIHLFHFHRKQWPPTDATEFISQRSKVTLIVMPSSQRLTRNDSRRCQSTTKIFQARLRRRMESSISISFTKELEIASLSMILKCIPKSSTNKISFHTLQCGPLFIIRLLITISCIFPG